MLIQAVDRKRCASCDCWQGERQIGSTPGTVAVDAETTPGLCQGGGWDGDERRARSACGHWRIWQALGNSDGASVLR